MSDHLAFDPSACQISNNTWSPFDLTVEPAWKILRARNASIHSVLDSGGPSTLNSLDLSSNRRLQSFGAIGGGICPSLLFFTCTDCGLQGELNELLTDLIQTQLLELQADKNDISGSAALFFARDKAVGLSTSIRRLDVHDNPRINGELPRAEVPYTELSSIDFSGTGVMGILPESWINLISLSQLNVQRTGLACHMQVDAHGEVSGNEATVDIRRLAQVDAANAPAGHHARSFNCIFLSLSCPRIVFCVC
jgi:hypothetical protein